MISIIVQLVHGRFKKTANIDPIRVDNYKFEKFDKFKYLSVNINNKSDMHIER